MVPSCDMSCAAQLETSKLTATLATLYTSVASDDGAAVNISFEVHATRTAHVRVNGASPIGLVCVCVRDGRWRIARIPNGSSCCVVLDSVCRPVLFGIGNETRHILCPNTNSMRTQFFFFCIHRK